MAKSQSGDIFAAEEAAEKKARGFFEKNSKLIVGATIGILVVIAGGYGYKHLILAPKEDKAQTQIIRAQHYFEIDSFNLALNGDNVALGFKDIADQYSGTNVGNGARLYAGISALHLGDFEGAIKYLESFSCDDPLLNARKYGCLGDAKAELNDMAAAATYYQKAVESAPDNKITAPTYLYRLAKAQEAAGKTAEAEATFDRLSNSFPESFEGVQAEKELARLQASK